MEARRASFESRPFKSEETVAINKAEVHPTNADVPPSSVITTLEWPLPDASVRQASQSRQYLPPESCDDCRQPSHEILWVCLHTGYFVSIQGQ